MEDLTCRFVLKKKGSDPFFLGTIRPLKSWAIDFFLAAVRYVSLRNNPSGTVSGWDGDPGPAGHLIFQASRTAWSISSSSFVPGTCSLFSK